MTQAREDRVMLAEVAHVSDVNHRYWCGFDQGLADEVGAILTSVVNQHDFEPADRARLLSALNNSAMLASPL